MEGRSAAWVPVAASSEDGEWVRDILDEVTGCEFRLMEPDPVAMIQMLEREQPAAVLVVRGTAGLVEELARSGVPVVAVEREGSVQRVRDLLKAGACDCVELPGETDRLAVALAGLLQPARRVAREGGKRGKLVGVSAAKGGVGATLVTVCLGAALARAYSKEATVAVVDLDPGKGDAAFLLGVRPERSLQDLVPVWEELSEDALRKVACRTPAGLELYVPGSAERFGERLTGERLESFLGFLRTVDDVVLADVPRQRGEALLSQCDQVFLCVTPDSLCVNATRGYVGRLVAAGVARQALALVVNRAHRRAEVKAAHVQRVLELPVAGEVPAAFWAVQEALNRQELPLGRRLGFSRSFEVLAQRITGQVPALRREAAGGIRARLGRRVGAGSKGSF